MNQITPQQALHILDIATQPNVKLSRADFVNCQAALESLNAFVIAHTPKKEENGDEPAKPE